MSLQDILQKILNEAQFQADQVKEGLEREREALLEDFTKKEILLKDSMDLKKKKALLKVTNKIDSMARREVKQKMLSANNEIANKAMDSFLEHLLNLSDDKYGEVIKKLFSRISEKEGIVLAPSKRLDVTKKFLPKGFSIEKNDSIKGGFIAKIGKAEVDNSFENLLFSELYGEIRGFFAEKLDLI